jgi:hypothetical protein
MARDLHGQDPVLGYSHGNDPVTGSTQIAPDVDRQAGLVLCGMAITAGVEEEEIEEILLMVGVKRRVA